MSKVKPVTTPGPAPQEPSSMNGTAAGESEIAALAHRLWLDRGCPEGSPEEDWLLAERELRRPRAPIVAPEERSAGTAECDLGGVDAPDEAPQPEKVLETDRLTGVRGTAISTQAD